MAPLVSRWVLPMRAVARARRVRASAAVAVSGVVASLSLAVALTVMVTSFRESVTYWLDVVLPADLYVRAATGAGTGESAFLTPQFVRAMQSVPGVQRVETVRTLALALEPAQPSVALPSRALGDPARSLALVGELVPVPVGVIAIFVSEPMLDLYVARPGSHFKPLADVFATPATTHASSGTTRFFLWLACGATMRASSAPSRWTAGTSNG